MKWIKAVLTVAFVVCTALMGEAAASGTAVTGAGGGDGAGDGLGGAGGSDGGRALEESKDESNAEVVGAEAEEEAVDGDEDEEAAAETSIGRKRRLNMNPPAVCRPFSKSRRTLATEFRDFVNQLGQALYTDSGTVHRTILRGLSVSGSSFYPFMQQHALEVEFAKRAREAHDFKEYDLKEQRKRWVSRSMKDWQVSEEKAGAMWDREMAEFVSSRYDEDVEADLKELADVCETAYGCGEKMDDYTRRFDGGGDDGGSGGGGGIGGGGLTA